MRLTFNIKKWLRRITRTLLVIVLTLFAIRVYDNQQGTHLELWHTVVPHELTAKQIAKTDWQGYLQAEQNLFIEVKQKVTDKLANNKAYLFNRYSAQSPLYPEHFKKNWNRSFILEPLGKPKGAVVLLHGLTDSPYSLRHIASHYQQRGFVAVVIRMPAHGTVPAALTDVHWEDWLAATKLAVKEAAKHIEPTDPLHIVGYSNGGALAVMYAIESMDDKQLPKVDQLILISPMIGVTSFARFAGLAGVPAIFPPFAKAAWIDLIAEYNPFKYNSFPINGARQSYELTKQLAKIWLPKDQQKVAKLQAEMPPILTFQSVIDSTVSSQSVISVLYNHLTNDKANELVLFDVNRNVKLGALLRDNAYNAITELLPAVPRAYQTTIITNASPTSNQAVAYVTKAKQTSQWFEPLGIVYPADIYSLSHIALPFPDTDSLYGHAPKQLNEFGVSLGVLAIRGERGVLVTSLDNLLRVSSNPFYEYILAKIDQTIDHSLQKVQQKN